MCRVAAQLLDAGERDAALFLIADDCNRELGKLIKDRVTEFRESAEEYNREDVETQLRWADLALQEGFFDRAETALRRADRAAHELSFFERDRVRGIVNVGQGPRRFHGRIRRLFRADEGLIGMTDDREVFFRVNPDMRGKVNVGDGVTFNLGWRIRGFRAVDVRFDAATSRRVAGPGATT